MKTINVIIISMLFLASKLQAQIGVGTITPSQMLDVETNDSIKTAIDINNTSTGNSVIQFQNNGSSKFSIGLDNSNTGKFKISSDTTFTSIPAIIIDSFQNVGIRTQSPSSNFEIQGSLGYKINTVNYDLTLDSTHHVVLCNNGPFTITLPLSQSCINRMYYIKNIDSDGDAISIICSGGDKINGLDTFLLNGYNKVVGIINSGANWQIINDVESVNAPISTISCGTATNNGTLINGVTASNVNSVLSYTGGKGGAYAGQTITSTGVLGLTATLSAGTFSSGAGDLTYTITGTPTSNGTATFAINISGKTCNLNRTVSDGFICGNIVYDQSNHAYGTVSSTTGKCWLDRNLGATQVATSSTDVNSYGDLYQWGRGADGHQLRNSTTISILSSINVPSHSNFIISSNDWLSTQNNNLWQGVNGVNNPCPAGFRIPTDAEWVSEKATWNSGNSAGAFNSALKLPLAGIRYNVDGQIANVGTDGVVWSSTISSTYSKVLTWSTTSFSFTSIWRSRGNSVRCIKD